MDFLVAMCLISITLQLQDDGVQIIENAEGKRTTPSFVAFTEAGSVG